MALSTAGFPLPRTLFELFSGASGLGLGLHRAIPGLRTVGHVEREAYAAAVLVARMAEALLDPAPIWDDVATFDGRAWRGVVDLLAGGFPCQDISVAGKGAGLAGARSGLWSEFARIISEVRPRYVFIENVAALRSRGLDSVLFDLAALGFNAEWTCYRASDAGAPHRRDRIFILAHAPDERRDGIDPLLWPDPTGRISGSVPKTPGSGPELAHTGGDNLRDESGGRSWANGAGASVAGHVGAELAHTERAEREPDQFDPVVHDSEGSQWGEAPDQSRGGRPSLGYPDLPGLEGWGLRGGERCSKWPARSPSFGDRDQPFPPGPDDTDAWARILAMRPDLEPAVCRVADGLANRVERLRLCGNGVVPIQAANAFRILWDRMISR